MSRPSAPSPLAATASREMIPHISLFGHPPHEMRQLPISARAYETPAGVARKVKALSSVTTPSDFKILSAIFAAEQAKRDARILTYQSSGIGQNEYSGMTHVSVEKRAYFLCRPINQEAANARLLCMLLGTDTVTKAMGVYAKSSKTPFSGGFLRVDAKQIASPSLRSLAEQFPRLKHTKSSFRILEKSGEFYNIKLDVPLSFIFLLHAQGRIKDPKIEITDSGVYLKVESNDKAGIIKWRCQLIRSASGPAASPSGTARAAGESELHDRIPDWYFPLYYGALEKEPERSDFTENSEYMSALERYQEKLQLPQILASWRQKLNIVPDWFSHIQRAHPELELEWELDQLLNITELQNGEYRDIIILGRTVDGVKLPLISDYDLLAVIPDQMMTDDEIWNLQIEAGVLDARQYNILRRRDGLILRPENRHEILLASGRPDFSRCFIDRALYFSTLSELGPLTTAGNAAKKADSQARYRHNTITGYGTLAEGDLTAVFNAKSAEYAHHYESLRLANIAKLRQKSGLTERETSTSSAAATAEETTAAPATTEEPAHYSLSAHHGPETGNPKPEPLVWELEGSRIQGIFSCDMHGDFCELSSPEEFIAFCQAILQADERYGTKHVIPFNCHWDPRFIEQLASRVGQENLISFNGARLQQELAQKYIAKRFNRLHGILSETREERRNDTIRSTGSSEPGSSTILPLATTRNLAAEFSAVKGEITRASGRLLLKPLSNSAYAGVRLVASTSLFPRKLEPLHIQGTKAAIQYRLGWPSFRPTFGA